MFERLQKPFLTVDTGEAYQPIRLSFDIQDKSKLLDILNTKKCLEKNLAGNSWNWFWRDEANNLNFESIASFKRNPDFPVRLGTLTVRDNGLFLMLPSFKRACLAVPFFHNLITKEVAQIKKADFLNKVFGTDERLPHGFSELFKDEELDSIIHEREEEYKAVQAKCEEAASAEEAQKLLDDYLQKENQKKLPYAERFTFETLNDYDPDVVFLSFYIYLRGRELVAIQRWYGETGYTLSSVVDDIIPQIFGDMDIDILE